MDPFTQGAIAAAAARTAIRRTPAWPVLAVAFSAGLAPDLDILIRSDRDPLLFLDYHRQFTHSLVFLPAGALLISALLQPLLRRWLAWRVTFVAALTGMATHGLLDACTSYGTQLLWPFSEQRIAWNLVAVIDPLFTVPLALLTLFAVRRSQGLWPAAGLLWAACYLAVCGLQHYRASIAAVMLAEARGHSVERLLIKPSFGNILLWKSLYEQDGSYQVDAIRLTGTVEYCQGSSAPVFDRTALSGLRPGSQSDVDVTRFQTFSEGYLTYEPEGRRLLDVRYSMVPNAITPLWGIVIPEHPEPGEHVGWWADRTTSPDQRQVFMNLLRGQGCAALPLDPHPRPAP